MQILGFWLVALGLVTGAYAQTLSAGLRPASVAIAVMGAAISFLFVCLDRRTRNLVKIAEVELTQAASPVSRMLAASNQARFTYTKIIMLIEGTAVLSLLLLAAYAAWCPLPAPSPVTPPK